MRKALALMVLLVSLESGTAAAEETVDGDPAQKPALHLL
jgi:hypothetical protein